MEGCLQFMAAASLSVLPLEDVMLADPLTAHLTQRLIRYAVHRRIRLEWPEAEGELEGRDVVNIFATMCELTRDDFMGLTTTPCPLGAMRLVNQIDVRCSTLREATRLAILAVSTMTQAAHINLTEDGKKATVDIMFDVGDKDPDHILCQWHMILWHKRSQWLIGAEIPLEQVELAQPMQLGFGAYARMFGSNCIFHSDKNRLTFAADLLDRRIIRTPQELDQMMKEITGNFVSPKTVSRTWKHQVKNVLQTDIANDRPMSTIESLADEMHISSQTLYRHLKAEGASYRSLKHEVRRDTALNAMSTQDITLGEASLKAGFAETNGLGRSLRSSSGTDASTLRQQVETWRASTQR
jgi:AraC-like DNA-binding protein